MSDLGQLEGMASVLDHLDLYAEGMKANALIAAGEIAALLEGYAKSHHKWGNPYSKGYTPTGATDVSTKGTVIDGGEIIDIYLSAGMDYDVFLELARSGKWAWLWPALTANAGRIKAILVRRLGGGTVQGVHGGDVTEL